VVAALANIPELGIDVHRREGGIDAKNNNSNCYQCDDITEYWFSSTIFSSEITNMVDWGMTAVILSLVSLPFVLSPAASNIITRLLRSVLGIFSTGATTCRALRWNDLGSTRLHVCSGSCCVPRTNSIPADDGSHPATSKCFDHIYSHVLEVAWKSTRFRYVAKPDYLPLGTNYLRTDGDTLLAFIIITARGWRSVWEPDPIPGLPSWTFSSGSTNLHLYQCSQPNGQAYFIGHMKYECGRSNSPAVNSDALGLTKGEVLRIANGAPPWYRQTFQAWSGVKIDFPVTELRDALRGGWIVAVGLSIHDPVNAYNGAFVKEYEKACMRVLQTVTEVLIPSFGAASPSGRICQHAERILGHMIRHSTGSGIPLKDTPFVDCDGVNVKNLVGEYSKEQCMFAIKIFRDQSFVQLDDADQERLEPILVGVLGAAICGMYQWYQYHNNRGSALPRWLLYDGIRDAPIWLMDCKRSAVS
jgi:hypothetical protein